MNKLIVFTPLEPYFFGSERIFNFDVGNRHYFIRSLDTPSQATLFGALRFLGVRNTSIGFTTDGQKENKVNIGSDSFNLLHPNGNFGRINGISPLYLVCEENGKKNFYIRTPLIHKAGPYCDRTKVYSEFEFDDTEVHTSHENRIFPKQKEFEPKHEVADSWMQTNGNDVRCELFKNVVNIGIDKNKPKEAFFKKEYKKLENDFSFAFFADLQDGFTINQKEVFLGQGKSSFGVRVFDDVEEPNIYDVAALLKKDLVYAQSDIYCAQDLCKECLFSAVETRDFRVFRTNYGAQNTNGLYTRGDQVKLIRAGSVFLPKDADIFKERIEENDHARKAGFNYIIVGGKES